MHSAAIDEVGKIPIFYLKKTWCHYQNLKSSQQDFEPLEWNYIIVVFNAFGIGLEPAVQYPFNECTNFSDFENWIEENGSVSTSVIEQFNRILAPKDDLAQLTYKPIFTEEEILQWQKDGYIILKNGITVEACAKTVQLIYQCIDADPDDSETWYSPHPLKNGIMIQLFN